MLSGHLSSPALSEAGWRSTKVSQFQAGSEVWADGALAGFVFFVLTAPVAAHLVAKAAHAAGYRLTRLTVLDDMRDALLPVLERFRDAGYSYDSFSRANGGSGKPDRAALARLVAPPPEATGRLLR